jgi:uncharacterized damage-inducible protein DinB
LTDEDLGWRPGSDQYTLGQQFLHIAQSEDFQIQAHLNHDWDYERARFPARELMVDELRALLNETRSRTTAALSELDEDRLKEPVDHGKGQPIQTLRWWLWLLVEHEVHHKAQIAVYLRQMGKIPPYFAAPLEAGARPDVEMREKMGGF